MDTFRTLQQCIARQGGLKQAQSSEIAQCLLDALVDILNKGKEMSGVMKEAFEKARAEAHRFVQEHPVLAAVIVTLIALGILVLLAPWAIEALGFGKFGPVKGSFAAKWQSTYPNVPLRSWFSFFQRLGMRWGTNMRDMNMLGTMMSATKMWGLPLF